MRRRRSPAAISVCLGTESVVRVTVVRVRLAYLNVLFAFSYASLIII